MNWVKEMRVNTVLYNMSFIIQKGCLRAGICRGVGVSANHFVCSVSFTDPPSASIVIVDKTYQPGMSPATYLEAEIVLSFSGMDTFEGRM